MYFLPFVSITPARIALLIQPPRSRSNPPETVTSDGSLTAPKWSSPLGTRHLPVSIADPLNSSLQFSTYPDGAAAMAVCAHSSATAESNATFVRVMLPFTVPPLWCVQEQCRLTAPVPKVHCSSCRPRTPWPAFARDKSGD